MVFLSSVDSSERCVCEWECVGTVFKDIMPKKQEKNCRGVITFSSFHSFFFCGNDTAAPSFLDSTMMIIL